MSTVEEVERRFFQSAQWSREATDHIKIVDSRITCKKGVNELGFYAAGPAIVLEKIAVYHKAAAAVNGRQDERVHIQKGGM